MDAFDFVIVGAGSAGSVLANRLTASGKYTVLLLEAGGSDKTPLVQIPIGYGKIFYDAAVNWKYITEPDPNLDNRPIYWPRGKVLGGSSSINAMVYVRGHQNDYAEWNAAAPGWGWSDVEPLFRRMENWDGAPSSARGKGGPLAVHDVRPEVHPLTRVYLEAAAQAGFPTNPDYNGPDMEGATTYQITTRNGFRASAARCYLDPAGKRPNLEVRTRAHATRVLFDGTRAIGVEYRHKGQIKTARARAEVILSGGAINSPQLLQLSGIGPGQVLQDHGIDVLLDAAQVGAEPSGPSGQRQSVCVQGGQPQSGTPSVDGQGQSGAALCADAQRSIVAQPQSGGWICPCVGRLPRTRYAALLFAGQLHPSACRRAAPDEPRPVPRFPDWVQPLQANERRAPANTIT